MSIAVLSHFILLFKVAFKKIAAKMKKGKKKKRTRRQKYAECRWSSASRLARDACKAQLKSIEEEKKNGEAAEESRARTLDASSIRIANVITGIKIGCHPTRSENEKETKESLAHRRDAPLVNRGKIRRREARSFEKV